MWPFGKQEGVALSREAALAARPQRMADVAQRRGARGELHLTVPRRDEGAVKWLKHLVAIPRKRTFELDDQGEWFWALCDGKHSLKDIGEALAKKTGAGREASRKAAFQYVGLLTRRGLVVIEVPAGKSRPKT
jgi:hypothetical protein